MEDIATTVTVPGDPIEDTTPELATVTPTANGAVEHPPFRDLRRLLPSQRNRIYQRALATAHELQGAEHLDESLAKEDISEDTLTGFDSFVQAMEKAEAVVLENAKDANAMTEWIISQDNPEQALFTLFHEVMESLKK